MTSNTTTTTTTATKTTAPNWSKIQENDVLCTKESPYCQHVGNRRVYVVIAFYMTKYYGGSLHSLSLKKERVIASCNMVKIIRNRKGRFLAKTVRGTWREIGNRMAIRWVSLKVKRAVASILEGHPLDQDFSFFSDQPLTLPDKMTDTIELDKEEVVQQEEEDFNASSIRRRYDGAALMDSLVQQTVSLSLGGGDVQENTNNNRQSAEAKTKSRAKLSRKCSFDQKVSAFLAKSSASKKQQQDEHPLVRTRV